jgi:hypothetical protein
MRSAAGAGNDYLNPAPGRCLGPLRHEIRRPMSRNHATLGWHAETFEHFGRVAHRLPVGGTSHDDSYKRSG